MNDEELDREVNDLINNFIKRWIPESYSHLVDTDENDGEKLRENIKELLQSQQREIIKLIKTYQNPYPEDVFTHNNDERLDIRRGRFNEFIFNVVENTRKDIIKLIEEEVQE